MSIDGAIFDMDMTILDSRTMWRTRMPQFLKQYCDEQLDEHMERSSTHPMNTALKFFCDMYRPDLDPESLYEPALDYIKEGYLREVDVYPDTVALIKELHEEHIPLAVASCTPKPLIIPALTTHNLLGYFDVVVSAADGHPGKHEPDVFDDALARLGTPRETTWIFEDSPIAARTARGAGYHVVGFHRKQKWEDTSCLQDIVTIFKSYEDSPITLDEIKAYSA